MADQAEIDLALKSGRAFLVLIQRVEDRSQLRIYCSKLQQTASVHVAYIDIIIEIKSTWPARSNQLELETGLGKHQTLRGDRHVQLTQDRRQIAEVRIGLQRYLAGVHSMLQ